MNFDSSVYELWLAECLGAGSDWLTSVTEFGSAQAFYEATEFEWRLMGVLSPTQIEKLKKRNLKSASAAVQVCKNNGWNIVHQNSEFYPPHLLNIKNSPAVLFVNGDLSCLKSKLTVSVVGAREASNYGKEIAFRLAASLVKAGVTVVSGGALGIDSASHEGAISAGGKTVSVMGCGLGSSYLPENEPLRKSVSENGAVISEYFPLTSPTRGSFPMRNRIISGMSLATVIVEAGEKSGSLGTARYAISQGRDVCAVPGDLISSAYTGSNILIAQGAKPVFSAADILSDYVYTYPELIDLSKVERTLEGRTAAAKPKQSAPVGLSIDAKTVYELFGSEELSYDYLITNSGLNASAMAATLTELELYGLITACPGKRYKIN